MGGATKRERALEGAEARRVCPHFTRVHADQWEELRARRAVNAASHGAARLERYLTENMEVWCREPGGRLPILMQSECCDRKPPMSRRMRTGASRALSSVFERTSRVHERKTKTTAASWRTPSCTTTSSVRRCLSDYLQCHLFADVAALAWLWTQR